MSSLNETLASGRPPAATSARHQVVIVGGGTAGLTVAAQLRRADPGLAIAVLEPSDKHYYQPLWTLVGAGVFPKEVSERPEARYIPRGVTWIRDAVAEFRPDEGRVLTRGGAAVAYDYLVVAPGIQIDWDRVRGLEEALGRDGVCSIYSYRHVDYTWQCIRELTGGTAVFTHPNTPIKCGAAPQKIMYLADDQFRRAGVRDRTRIIFGSAMATIFNVPRYTARLEAVVARKGIETRFQHNLVEVRGAAREAVFEHLDTGATVTVPYDLLHVTPPMGPPDVVRHSPLADQGGWVDVDRHTLRHVRYPNVFGLGDASNLPTSKSAAAVRKQAPVLVRHLLAAVRGGEAADTYDGYTACPITTGYGRVILAEFDYELRPRETFPFDQSKERLSMYLLKKYGLPFMYWHGMLKGLI
jgi:sulfide:quinone oxidoreductase